MAFLLLSLMALAMMTVGCKTHRKQLPSGIRDGGCKNRDSSGVDSTIYAKIRNSARTSDLVVTGDTMPMRTEYIGYTEDGGASRETIGRYNVVVGQFKQVFNARQMRARLQSSGYDSAFIIHTRVNPSTMSALRHARLLRRLKKRLSE